MKRRGREKARRRYVYVYEYEYGNGSGYVHVYVSECGMMVCWYVSERCRWYTTELLLMAYSVNVHA